MSSRAYTPRSRSRLSMRQRASRRAGDRRTRCRAAGAPRWRRSWRPPRPGRPRRSRAPEADYLARGRRRAMKAAARGR
eukprot:scaffold255813_cov27-Tisochrysis_lutea.AAC.1